MNSAKIDLASISERKWTEENWEKKGWKLGESLKVSLIRMKKRVWVRDLKGGKDDLVVILCSTLTPNVKVMEM